MTRKSAILAAAIASASFAAAPTAVAYDPTWLTDRQYREGPGFLVGDFELHPGIAADFGYDSNWFRRDSSEDPIGALRLRVSPSFSVATLGPQRRADGAMPDFGFRFETGATYNEFIPVSGSEEGRDALRDQRDVSAFGRILFDILPGRAWSGRLHGGVARVIRPTNEGLPEDSFNRIIPQAGAELVWTPGSGLLDWRLGYAFRGAFFEDGDFSNLNNFENDVVTRGRWRFLPRTALIYDARLGFVTYPEAGGLTPNKTDSHTVRARLGANGLITPAFGALAMVGWGASFYSDNPQDFDSVIAQAEVKWYLQPTLTTDPMRVSPLLSGIAVGFARDFQDSYIGTYIEKDQGYVRFNYLFGGTFLLLAEVAAGAVVYPEQTNPDYGNPAGWTDVRTDARLFGEYRIRDFVALDAEVNFTGYFSDTVLTFPNVTGIDPLAYWQIAAFLGARVFM